MKKLSLLFILCLFAMSCNQAPQHEVTSAPPADNPTIAGPVKDGVFIHITECYDDPHRALMPLKMATMMAVRQRCTCIHGYSCSTSSDKGFKRPEFC